MATALSRISLIWIIPIAGLALVGYLGATTLAARGPKIIITFNSASGIAVGTKVAHKSVSLGSVTALALARDLGHVDATVQMTSDAKLYLTDHARFWLVRANVSNGAVVDLATLVSGSYVEMDPGLAGGTAQRSFKALNAPPGFRSDEPGSTFKLRAATIASLASGTPVFYRDVVVGEALGYQVSDRTPDVDGEVFIKAPYDKRVRTGSVWWQTSGVSTAWEANGLRVQFPSVQAALSGGLAFNVPPGAPDYPLAPPGTVFPLFASQPAAERASNRERLTYSVVFTSSAPGLAPGSPVLLFGRQVGEVTNIRLEAQLGEGEAVARVTLNVLPGAFVMIGQDAPVSDRDLAPRLVAGGMRAAVVTTSYVTGAQAVSLEFGARPATAPAMAGGVVVLPAVESNGFAGMLSSASGFLTSLKAMPLQSMGSAVNDTLLRLISSLNHSTVGTQAQSATRVLRAMGATVRRADASLAPLLASLPARMDGLRRQLSQANQSLAAADQSYSPGSTWQASLARKMATFYGTARYVRLLADYVSRHPEAIARGTSSQGSER